MTKTLAEVIAAHWSRTYIAGSRPFICLCGRRFNLIVAWSEHVAEALTEAGYGELAVKP